MFALRLLTFTSPVSPFTGAVFSIHRFPCSRRESRTLLPPQPPAPSPQAHKPTSPQALQRLGVASKRQQTAEMRTLMPLSASRKPLIPLGLVNKRSFEPLLRFSALSGHSSNLRDFQNAPCEPVNPTPPGFFAPNADTFLLARRTP